MLPVSQQSLQLSPEVANARPKTLYGNLSYAIRRGNQAGLRRWRYHVRYCLATEESSELFFTVTESPSAAIDSGDMLFIADLASPLLTVSGAASNSSTRAQRNRRLDGTVK